MADEVSKSGVFIDSKSGKVVEQQPEEGIQLVPPGGTIDSATAEVIEAAKTAADNAGQSAEPVVAADDDGDAKTAKTSRRA